MSATRPPSPVEALRERLANLSPKHRQYAMLAGILLGGFGLLWLILSLGEQPPAERNAAAAAKPPTRVTSPGVMAPGQQVNAVDQWVGTAGSKLAQYESERDEQSRLNRERQAFETRTLQRFAELEQRLGSPPQGGIAGTPGSPAAPGALPNSVPPALPTRAAPLTSPAPPAPLPLPSLASTGTLPPPPAPYRIAGSVTMPPGVPPGPAGAFQPQGWPHTSQASPPPTVPAPTITRVTVADRSARAAPPGPETGSPSSGEAPDARSVSTFLPVSFTRGTLLGGLDAPTGGQSQSNPHPVLIRLSDSSVLPNRFRGQYRECFVIAAGYGDISSERAYLRTESLSCVRADGSAMEIRIQGSIYGEDGKVGLRGRLVTKQGQMLANALLAGVVGGIGQGLSGSSATYSTSALGTIANVSGGEAYRAGLGSGVGRALDRLAQYYIKLAENTFPVIEIDAGREIDVVITRGVRVDLPMTARPSAGDPYGDPRHHAPDEAAAALSAERSGARSHRPYPPTSREVPDEDPD